MNAYQEINYGALIDEAMHYIVRRALGIAVQQGLPGNHHFFISFLTGYPGVTVSDRLRRQYPDEMTIVLQYQFDDLFVTQDHFSVILSFDSVKERIVVPFLALTAFADPSVRFGLRFSHVSTEDYYFSEDPYAMPGAAPRAAHGDMLGGMEEAQPSAGVGKRRTSSSKSKPPLPSQAADNVVALDHFRKKQPSKFQPDAKK